MERKIYHKTNGEIFFSLHAHHCFAHGCGKMDLLKENFHQLTIIYTKYYHGILSVPTVVIIGKCSKIIILCIEIEYSLYKYYSTVCSLKVCKVFHLIFDCFIIIKKKSYDIKMIIIDL